MQAQYVLFCFPPGKGKTGTTVGHGNLTEKGKSPLTSMLLLISATTDILAINRGDDLSQAVTSHSVHNNMSLTGTLKKYWRKTIKHKGLQLNVCSINWWHPSAPWFQPQLQEMTQKAGVHMSYGVKSVCELMFLLVYQNKMDWCQTVLLNFTFSHCYSSCALNWQSSGEDNLGQDRAGKSIRLSWSHGDRKIYFDALTSLSAKIRQDGRVQKLQNKQTDTEKY